VNKFNDVHLNRVLSYCERFHLRVITYFNEDGYIISVRDIPNGYEHHYFHHGHELRMCVSALSSIRKALLKGRRS
jgi:hypothetical protein